MDNPPQASQPYRHILLATDLSRYAEQVARRALKLARLYQARFTIAHAVEEMPIYSLEEDPIIPLDLDLDQKREALAREQLEALVKRLGEEGAGCEVLVGRPVTRIVEFARSRDVDLIAVGSHGRHGISRLLGSTATAILHHAPCDVLAVRVTE